MEHRREGGEQIINNHNIEHCKFSQALGFPACLIAGMDEPLTGVSGLPEKSVRCLHHITAPRAEQGYPCKAIPVYT